MAGHTKKIFLSKHKRNPKKNIKIFSNIIYDGINYIQIFIS